MPLDPPFPRVEWAISGVSRIPPLSRGAANSLRKLGALSTGVSANRRMKYAADRMCTREVHLETRLRVDLRTTGEDREVRWLVSPIQCVLLPPAIAIGGGQRDCVRNRIEAVATAALGIGAVVIITVLLIGWVIFLWPSCCD